MDQCVCLSWAGKSFGFGVPCRVKDCFLASEMSSENPRVSWPAKMRTQAQSNASRSFTVHGQLGSPFATLQFSTKSSGTRHITYSTLMYILLYIFIYIYTFKLFESSKCSCYLYIHTDTWIAYIYIYIHTYIHTYIHCEYNIKYIYILYNIHTICIYKYTCVCVYVWPY